MDDVITTSRYIVGLAQAAVADLDDSHLAQEPTPRIKTAGWLIGHLVMTGDFGRVLCGREPLLEPRWVRSFAPGTKPSLRREDYPSMAVLKELFDGVYADLSPAARLASPTTFAEPNPYEPARGAFPSKGDFVVYIMTGHLGYHLGQLNAWRTAAGLAIGTSQDGMAA